MISLDAIEAEIIELEKKDTSYAVIERLAWLYICRSNLRGDIIQEQQSVALSDAQSDFMKAVDGLPVEMVLEVIDEHLEAVKLLYPSEYSAIISRLSYISA